ncbi:Wadjet anti-phage system protein JetD domain-containing protein [Anaerocolumna jejuensis]|uniref:Wadjet anti-phage system protein JetD domain-containing protein n=1 Tax=Anaerocolumna jejuensis TaxID=259063 RepID=UPI003F7C6535
MNWEEKILEYLVDNYRKSKKDTGDNKINRRTQVKPEKLYKKYRENDGDFEVISEINRTVEDLCARGFLAYDKEMFGTQLNCIYLADEQIEVVEDYLHKKYEFIPKGMKKDEIQEIIARYHDLSEICAMECDCLQQELDRNKIPKDYKELPKVFDAVAFIENNQTELFVREASMKIYGDSKYFEENTLIPVCQMLRKYKNRPCSLEELLDEILVDFGIKKEPQKLCIKGNFILSIDGKELDFSMLPEGIELDARSIEKIDCIKLGTTRFMTIENRTSYLRYSAFSEVIFYLGGYANRFQRNFIKKVYEDNQDVEYLHFGDIDAGGFWIHYNLCKITGVEFKTFSMSEDELTMKQYKNCLQPLTDNDIARLQELKEVEVYAGTIQYMLQNNVKLEQEIISLELMK